MLVSFVKYIRYYNLINYFTSIGSFRQHLHPAIVWECLLLFLDPPLAEQEQTL